MFYITPDVILCLSVPSFSCFPVQHSNQTLEKVRAALLREVYTRPTIWMHVARQAFLYIGLHPAAASL